MNKCSQSLPITVLSNTHKILRNLDFFLIKCIHIPVQKKNTQPIIISVAI